MYGMGLTCWHHFWRPRWFNDFLGMLPFPSKVTFPVVATNAVSQIKCRSSAVLLHVPSTTSTASRPWVCLFDVFFSWFGISSIPKQPRNLFIYVQLSLNKFGNQGSWRCVWQMPMILTYLKSRRTWSHLCGFENMFGRRVLASQTCFRFSQTYDRRWFYWRGCCGSSLPSEDTCQHQRLFCCLKLFFGTIWHDWNCASPMLTTSGFGLTLLLVISLEQHAAQTL